MSDKRHPRPWTVTHTTIGDANGTCVCDLGYYDFKPGAEWPDLDLILGMAAAIVGAVNAADASLPLETVLANLAAGKTA